MLLVACSSTDNVTDAGSDGGTSDAATAGEAGAGKQKDLGFECLTDSECLSGRCIDQAEHPRDGGCISVGKACAVLCSEIGDCKRLGPEFKCFGGCDTTTYCGI